MERLHQRGPVKKDSDRTKHSAAWLLLILLLLAVLIIYVIMTGTAAFPHGWPPLGTPTAARTGVE